MTKSRVIILNDQRPGNYSQSLALATALEHKISTTHETLNLSYNLFAKLPNFFIKSNIFNLSDISASDVILLVNSINKSSQPTILISAGRKTASTALFIKKESVNVKVAQIMQPDMPFELFDFVILPRHDNIKSHPKSSIIQTLGAITNIDPDKIDNDVKKFPELSQISKKKIALFVGGDTKKTTFHKNSAKTLAVKCSDFAHKNDAALFVVTSRRTSKSTSEALKQNLACDYRFFDWNEVIDNNPYSALLGICNMFVVTGDSVSMISECASTGKPVFIFDDGKISQRKHKDFHSQMIDGGYAYDFSKLSDYKFDLSQESKKLNEAQRVAQIIYESVSLPRTKL